MEQVHFFKLWIPVLKDVVKLVAPWTGRVMNETRNGKFLEAVEESSVGTVWGWQGMNPHQVTLPVGTVLEFDRIYIRQGNEDYNSVTWRVLAAPGLPKKVVGTRFWVHVNQANEMVVERTWAPEVTAKREAAAQRRTDLAIRKEAWKEKFNKLVLEMLGNPRGRWVRWSDISAGLRAQAGKTAECKVEFDYDYPSQIKVLVTVDENRMPVSVQRVS